MHEVLMCWVIDLLFAINNCRTHLTEGKLCQSLSYPLYSYNEAVLSPSIVPQNIVSVASREQLTCTVATLPSKI